ncbi:hypothetical protein DB30_08169 [Enhygromyxa salina]|uniref:Plasmid stabilization system protein n=1 Tax=Enhygromyxa salina TaxID=215803 RepID=A0A0C2CZV3_9BACT|nr:hypothetical protein [Enhygromyxa salina]KIG13402.1 hypothetical protein DB30_08169 [Enhygromyxa salina]
MSKPVITTSDADLQILELDAWWREHRDKSPDLFETELAQAFELISFVPGAGKGHPHPRDPVRRLMLRRTRNHVYYVEYGDHVLVVAVWGAVKGAGPDFTGL